MFTRRHYQAIAAVLRANQPGELPSYVPQYQKRKRRACCNHHRCIVDQLANLFVQDNPRFDWDKFITAATRPE